jgi:hypothetical protein
MMTVVKNLYKLDITSDIFITRQYHTHMKENSPSFRGKKPTWLSNYPTKYHLLFRFIDKKLYHFAISAIPDTIEDDLFQFIQLYFQISHETIEHFKLRFYECKYSNKVHIIWSIICLFIFNKCNGGEDTFSHKEWYGVTKKTVYIGCSDIEYNEIVRIHEDPIPHDKFNHPQVYKTLEFKRKYSIYPKCRSFNLMRSIFSDHNNETIANCLWYGWQFYAYECPIWKSRFNNYNISVKADTHKILFHDDNELELFHSQFGYDPDEQSTETQNKGLLLDCNSSMCWRNWYDDVFTRPSLYDFNDNFKFKY